MNSATTVKIYGNAHCAYCTAARMLLTRKGIEFEEISVSADPARLDEMVQRSGSKSVPQVFIGDKHVGGFAELCELDKNGKLDALLAGA